MIKVLFVVPPYSSWGVEVIGTWPPLQIAYLAGAVEQAGGEARICDAMNLEGGSLETIRKAVEAHQPEVVVAFDYLPVTGAISTAVVPAALEALALAKRVAPAATTIMGGPFPTFRHEELLNHPSGAVDLVLRGEAEATLAELVPRLAEGACPARPLDDVAGLAFRRDGVVITTPMRPHLQDLDTLKPAWHLLDWELYRYRIEPPGRMASVLTSRGCMMGCSFCSHRAFWRGEWRSRRPERVLEEVRHLVSAYGVESITLIDPYPTSDRDRWEHLLDLFIEARLGVRLLMETRAEDVVRDADILPKYRDAGVVHLYIGAEAATDELLESLNKGNDVNAIARAIALARDHGIVTEASFMIGHPAETWASIERTIEVAIRMDPDIAVFPVLTPMPFTPLFEQYRERIRVTDYSAYNLSTPIIEPFAMSLEDVGVALGKCYMDFYSQKIPRIRALPEGFKRRYLLSACREMMRAYGHHFAHLGDRMPRMPPDHALPG